MCPYAHQKCRSVKYLQLGNVSHQVRDILEGEIRCNRKQPKPPSGGKKRT